MFNDTTPTEFYKPVLWECRVRRVVDNNGGEAGVGQCTTIRPVPLPRITINQRVRFAIYCALEVYRNKKFRNWAEQWLSVKDRSYKTPDEVECENTAAWGAVRAASWVTEIEKTTWAVKRSYATRWAIERAILATTCYEVRAAKLNILALIKKAIKDEPD
jgi:hypothetical protein